MSEYQLPGDRLAIAERDANDPLASAEDRHSAADEAEYWREYLAIFGNKWVPHYEYTMGDEDWLHSLCANARDIPLPE